jgi:hypothetical protein
MGTPGIPQQLAAKLFCLPQHIGYVFGAAGTDFDQALLCGTGEPRVVSKRGSTVSGSAAAHSREYISH